ncbi:MAG: TraR/DksA C4-type zinc finger protein [Rhodospirillales bacterium]
MLLAKALDLRSLEAGSKLSREPVELDQTRVGRLSRVDALQGQAMAQEQHRRRQIELARIEAALQRIDQGEYGWCLKCSHPIAVARLEADPAAPLCVDCASRS